MLLTLNIGNALDLVCELSEFLLELLVTDLFFYGMLLLKFNKRLLHLI